MLNAKKFGLAAGLLWGIGLFLLTIISLLTGYATGILNLLSEAYIGYSISLGGAFIGLIYGFLDGFIGCFLFAWLYNKLLEKK